MKFDVGDTVWVDYGTGVVPIKVTVLAVERDTGTYKVTTGLVSWSVSEQFMTRWYEIDNYGYGTGSSSRDNDEPICKDRSDPEVHTWIDTGFSLTFCRLCDITGRRDAGTVHIIEKRREPKDEPNNANPPKWITL